MVNVEQLKSSVNRMSADVVRDAVNELRPMSATTMIAFGRALAGMKSACIFHALGLKQAIDAATTEAEIRAIDITAGWP